MTRREVQRQLQRPPNMAKTAVIVGVGPGTSRSVALKFAAQKYNVALVSRRPQPDIEKEITQSGGKVLTVNADPGNQGSVQAAHKKIVESFGHPEVLIYNAGPGGFQWPPPSILDTPADKFAEGFEAGVTGALLWIQQLVPAQIEAGRGTLIFTGATASLRGGAKFAMLACPKFALRALTQSAAREFQNQGIHVAHVIIDGIIAGSRGRPFGPDKLSPDAIAEEYWRLHTQDRSAWTQELDLRPFSEKF